MQKFSQHPVIYNPLWPQYFLEVAVQIKKALGENVVRIHHVGSTAIPGLMAKPIIDILGEAEDISKIACSEKIMEILGFEFKGEFGIPQRAYFSRKNNIAVHLHIFPENHFQVEKHLIFRDYLIEHQEAVNAYQQKKEELLKIFPHDREAYQNGKNDLIVELTRSAYIWKGKLPPKYL
ncbi:MAG: GrpB family protein [Bacteriovorax sp.]|nr:GrpB family protein [Bacteriovorax sp.]